MNWGGATCSAGIGAIKTEGLRKYYASIAYVSGHGDLGDKGSMPIVPACFCNNS